LLAGELDLVKNKLRDGVREGRGNWERSRLGLETMFISNKGQVEWSTIGVSERDGSLLVTIRVTRLREGDAVTSFNFIVVGTIFLMDTGVSDDGDEFYRFTRVNAARC